MTLRRPIIALFVAILGSPTAAFAANYRTANFSVDAPTPELAKKFGDMAEFYRKEKALDWLGQEMPQWHTPCPLLVQISMGGAGGATTFSFGSDAGGRPVVTSRKMEIHGETKQLLNSVLPHEVTHTVLAYRFGRPVPRWADEGGSVLSENDEERYTHDVRNRELLNAGRGIRLPVLFRMVEYPRDMIVLYAQGYSICAYLVEKGGGGREGRGRLLEFLALGMQGNDPNSHGTRDSWNEASRKVYGFDSVDAMEAAWLQALKAPPSRTAAREAGNTLRTSAPATSVSTSTGANPNRVELRSSGSTAIPVLEPPVKARAASPDYEPARPTYLPAANATPTSAPATTPVRQPLPEIPPPVLLPPELSNPGRP
jgi:hypothetical protein